MKFVLTLLAAAALLHALPAAAYAQPSHYDAAFGSEPDTQALVFLRIPLAENKQREQQPRIGFGIFTDCSRLATDLSESRRSACEDHSIRSLEFSRGLYERNWLLSFSGEKRWVGLARFYPGSGFAPTAESGPSFLDDDDRFFGRNR